MSVSPSPAVGAYVGITGKILDDFFLVQPPAVAVVKFLRKIPVVESLSQM
jgi:hypothetical protein